MSNQKLLLSLTAAFVLLATAPSQAQSALPMTQAEKQAMLLEKVLSQNAALHGTRQVEIKASAERKSVKRIELLAELLEEAFEGGAESPDAAAQEALPKFTGTEACLTNGDRAAYITEDVTEAQAEKALTETAYAEYPDFSNEELKQLAALVYPMYKPKDKVTVTYKETPRSTAKVTGIFNGVKGGYIAVGARNIRIDDLRGIVGNDGPDGEVAKYSRTDNDALRQELIDNYIKMSVINRNKFIEEQREAFVALQTANDAAINEANGWTELEGQWLPPEKLASELASLLSSARRNAELANLNKAIAAMAADAEAQIAVSRMAAQLSLSAAPKATALAVTSTSGSAADVAAASGDTAADEYADGTETNATAPVEHIVKDTSSEHQTQDIDTTVSSHLSTWVYIVISAVVVLGIAFAVYKYNDREKELDVSSFFVGHGKLQQEFWAAADASPDTFKYVAYLFPDLEQAQKALVQLSFISIDEHGIIQARRQDLKVGAYDHQGRAVAFIGGEKLNYARWREATMTWPELPGAAYFKVSGEPEVNLDIPDMGSDNDAENAIQNLGTEDIKGDDGEITRVYKFSSPSREQAIAFLEQFNISEEGIMVQVETAEGAISKDINGIFTA